MTSKQFLNVLSTVSPHPLHVLNPAISKSEYVQLDLSESNQSLKKVDLSASSTFSKYIKDYLKAHKACVAYGGYNEIRSLYNRSDHFESNASERRNIHIGMDFWCDAGTAIFAPLEGQVHSFKNNDNFGDYGPTIVLKHMVSEVSFFTLYGHLSMESLDGLTIGQTVKAGDQLATLGDAKVNGDYPPHLHFQIIRDVQGWSGDYPGVCGKSDLEFYLTNCPDPNLFFRLNP